MEVERKEWKSLYLINKQIYFLGFKPLQWVMLTSILFMVGWFAWWIAILLLPVVYYLGKKISKLQSAGNPDVIMSFIVWNSMKKYFVDSQNIFEKLRENESS